MNFTCRELFSSDSLDYNVFSNFEIIRLIVIELSPSPYMNLIPRCIPFTVLFYVSADLGRIKARAYGLQTRPIFLERHIYQLRYPCVFYSYPVRPPQFPTAAIHT